ncbi:MAG: DUF3616 domain-containing protein, partial [Rhodobiaceae bacterium]|nr:DUF3616 domain-containing protein [Rhodobiaceae bacterium]
DDGRLLISMNSTGYQNLHMRFDYFYSDNDIGSTANAFELEYSTNGGATFTPLATITGVDDNEYHTVSFDLSSVAALNNQSNLVFRIYDAQGDINQDIAFDNIEITGDLITAQTVTLDVDQSDTTDFVQVGTDERGFIGASIGDPTDPLSTLGINFDFNFSPTIGNEAIGITSSNSAVFGSYLESGTLADKTYKLLSGGTAGTAVASFTAISGGGSDQYFLNLAFSADLGRSDARYHYGASDGSAAIPIGTDYMLVADDETQTIRLYDRTDSGVALNTFNFTAPQFGSGESALNAALAAPSPEVDIEAAVRVGSTIYFVGSHGNESDGTNAPDRSTIFATTISGTDASTTLAYGDEYKGLTQDLITWDVTNGHGLGANFFGINAAINTNKSPEQNDGFNVEGIVMAPGSATTAFLSLRAPIINDGGTDKAVIVPITNFTSLPGLAPGSATFGAPILLDLDGHAIRDIAKNAADQYVILAGPAGSAIGTGDFALYTWDGTAGSAPVLRGGDLQAIANATGGSPEAIVEVPAGLDGDSVIQILYDNGDTVWYNNGVVSKDLAYTAQEKFVSIQTPLDGFAPTVPDRSTMTPESTTLVASVQGTAGGNTAATDPEGQTLTWTEVNGIPIAGYGNSVANNITLGNGTTLRPLDTSGTFAFIQNNLFDPVPVGQTDSSTSFTFTLFDGFKSTTATQTLAVTGIDSNDNFDGVTTDGNDTINAGIGNDTVHGKGGNDVIEGGPGADTIDGGTGNDTASYAGSTVGVNVQLQYHVATGGDAEGDTLTSIERLTGSGQNDTLYGDPGANIIRGGGGSDHIKGFNGADNLYGDLGDDWLYVDSLDNAALGGGGTDRLIVVGSGGVINAVGANSIEIATGNVGDDQFDGSAASADLTLKGLSGMDVLIGGSGDDYIYGGSGADGLFGNDGLDRIFMDENDSIVDGGAGDEDRLIVQQLASATVGVNIDVAAAHFEIAYGNFNDDTFDGSSATVALSLFGRQGQDVLLGGSANDRLYGDNNDTSTGDILNGGQGNDYLRGGTNGAGGFAERDQFVFDDQWGNDRIFDFANNGAEKIDFNTIAGITQRSDLTITDGAGFALISYHDAVGGWDASIRVDGVTAAQLQDNDFIYV